MKNLKVLFLAATMVALLGSNARRADAAVFTLQLNSGVPALGDGTTSGAASVDMTASPIQGAVYNNWTDGIYTVDLEFSAYRDASNLKIVSRRFLVSVASGTMTLAASQLLADGPSVGLALLLASCTIVPDNTNKTLIPRCTGVTGSNITWGTSLTAFYTNAN